MQVVKKALLVLFLVLLSLAIFAPKRELYYLLEERLMQEDIIITNEVIEDGLLSLTLKHPEIYFKGIRVAQIESVRLWSVLFYTKLAIKSIELDKTLQRFVATQVEKVAITHTIIAPQQLSLQGEGGFGLIEGSVLLDTRVARVNLSDEQLITKLKPFLKKDDKGWYYETSF